MLYAGSPLANWRVIFTKLVYYGRMEVKELESYLLINLLGNYIYSTFFAIFICGRDPQNHRSGDDDREI